MRKLNGLLNVLAALTTIAFTGNTVLAADGTVPIGVISPQSGELAVYGQSIVNGVKLAVDEINAKGGVLGGKKLEITYQDDKGDATEGINAYNKLMSAKVKAIIGPVTSGVGAGIAAKANAEKMLMLTPSGTADSLTVGKASVFRACYTDSYQGKIVAKFLATNLKVKKAAVLYCNADEYSLGLYESFKEASKEFGIEIVAVETSASMNDVDFTAQLGQITSSGAEAIFAPYYYGTVALLVPQARQAGFSGIMIGADGWDGTKVGDNAAAFDKCYFTNHYTPDDPSPAVQNFVKAYTAKYGTDSLNVMSALAYDSTYMMAQAINDAKSDDTAALIAAMAKLNFKGVTGSFTLDANGDPKKGAAIIEYKGGKLTWNTTVE